MDSAIRQRLLAAIGYSSERPSGESAWRRGWNDAKLAWSDWRFIVADMVAIPVVGVFVHPVAAIAVAILSLISVWVVATAIAPNRQRDEALALEADLLANASLQFSELRINKAERTGRSSLFTATGQEIRYLDLELEIALRNVSDISIQYEISEMRFVMEGHTNPSPNMANWGVAVLPNMNEVFRYDWLRGLSIARSPMRGELKYRIDWWPVAEATVRKTEHFDFALTYWPTENRLQWVPQQGTPKPSIPDTEDSQNLEAE